MQIREGQGDAGDAEKELGDLGDSGGWKVI